MPKMLITSATVVNFGDDRGGVHQDAGDMPDVPKAEAVKLVHAGRALYTSKADDPAGGRHTADRDMIRAAQDLAAARKKKAGEVQTSAPTGEGAGE